MEYVWCMDSDNREVKAEQKEPVVNPTNDILIQTSLSNVSMVVNRIELATIEIPRAQYLIEKSWNRLYRYAGFEVPSKYGNSLWISSASTPTTIINLPYSLNVATSFSQAGDVLTVQTADQHQLRLLPFYHDVQIVGLRSTVVLHESNVLIIDTSTFQVSGVAAGSWLPGDTGNATLVFPPLVSPNRVVDALNFENPDFAWSYDTQASRFCLQANTNTVFTLYGDLAVLLGFLQTVRFSKKERIYASASPTGTTFFEVPEGNYNAENLARALTLAGNSFYLHLDPPENVNPIDPPPIYIPALRSVHTSVQNTPSLIGTFILTIGTLDGQTHTVLIPNGMYTCPSLASTLTRLLIVWNVEVQYHEGIGFCFFSTDGVNFSLEFQNIALTNVNRRLGFRAARYSCFNEYCSNEYVNCVEILIAAPCGGVSSGKFDNTVWHVRDNQSLKKFEFYCECLPPLDSRYTTIEAGTEPNTLVFTNLHQAHGFQVGEIATITVMGVVYNFLVIVVPDGLQFIVDSGVVVLLPLPVFPTGVAIVSSTLSSTSVQISYVGGIALGSSILVSCGDTTYVGTVSVSNPAYFQVELSPAFVCVDPTLTESRVALGVTNNKVPSCSIITSTLNECAIQTAILGLSTDTDILYDMVNPVLIAPFMYRVMPNYVLLEMLEPIGGSSRVEHNHKNQDRKTTIMAKIIMLEFPILERFYPMSATFFGGTKLKYCRFRILNPDHSLYQLHGIKWSATFRLFTNEKQLLL